jgi:hypothetical protein
VVPVALNLAAGLWVVRLLGDDLAGLAPARRRVDAAAGVELVAVVAVVVALLFLPGLALFGMEHTLHMALVLAAALAVEARWVRLDAGDGPGRSPGHSPGRSRPGWAPFALIALAAATRGETGFVAVALAAGLVVAGCHGWHDPAAPPAAWRRRRAAIAGLGAATAVPLAVFGALNLAYGQELLPNSVVLKSLGDRGDTRRSLGAAAERLVSDPLLVALVVLAVTVLVLARRGEGDRSLQRRAVFPAAVTLVAVLLQVELGGVEPLLRYQAYLYGLGAWMVLRALPAFHLIASRRWPRVPAAALVLVLVPVAVMQVRTTGAVPHHSAVTWEQRYQVARFLEDAYRHDAIAIGELGYIGLYHQGPLTDVYGLGDHEVMEATIDDRKDAAFWHELQQRRGFRVVAAYDFALGDQAPDDWIAVADWRSTDAYFEVTRFWATVPEEVGPLLDHLRAYEAELPDRVEVTYNELAPIGAALRLGEQAGG